MTGQSTAAVEQRAAPAGDRPAAHGGPRQLNLQFTCIYQTTTRSGAPQSGPATALGGGARLSPEVFGSAASRRVFFGILAAGLAPGRAPADERPRAPDFRLRDAQGIVRKLSDFRGKVVLLHFWATWCAHCRTEIPALIRVHRDYQADGFTVVAVAMDERGWAAVTPFLAQYKVNYPVLLGDGAVARQYGGLTTLPRTLFLDRNGRVVASHDAVLPETHLRKIVKALLAEAREQK